MTSSLAVAIPTFRRPEALALAVRSVIAQTFSANFELIIIDNDPDGSARDVFDLLTRSAPPHIEMKYVWEREAGVANARNAAVASTACRLVAFLDDDQEASPGWIDALMRFSASFPAAVTFGPVETVLPDSVREHTGYFKQFFARHHPGASGYCTQSYGCGNSLIDMQLIPAARPVFDAAMNETGGEDDILFKRVREAGGRFAWCEEAVVQEHVPASRARLSYTLLRSVAYGQGPITLARRRQPPDYPAIALWMLVGLYKCVGNALLFGVKWVIRAQDRATYLDRAARGAGKLVWWVQLRFYGAAGLRARNDKVA